MNDKKVSFLDLDFDILVFYIFPHLHVTDLLNFSLINKTVHKIFNSPYYSQVIDTLFFKKLFFDKEASYLKNTEIENEVKRKLKEKTLITSTKTLYWGLFEDNLLLHLKNPQFNANKKKNIFNNFYVNKPLEYPLIDDSIIISLIALEDSFFIFTTKGLYTFGSRIENRVNYDININRLIKIDGFDCNMLLDEKESVNTDVYTLNNYIKKKCFAVDFFNNFCKNLVECNQRFSRNTSNESGFVKKLYLSTAPETNNKKIITVEGKCRTLFALDSKNNLYIWDYGNNSLLGIQLLFQELTEENKILKIDPGKYFSVLLMHNVGLVILYDRSLISKKQLDSFFKGISNLTAKAKTFVILGTRNDIEAFSTGNDFVIYLSKKHNDLYMLKLKISTKELMDNRFTITSKSYTIKKFPNFKKWKKKLNGLSCQHAPCVRIKCYETVFVIVLSNSKLLLGNVLDLQSSDDNTNDFNLNNLLTINLSKDNQIYSLALSGYHLLVSTKKNTLLSFGLESNNCGVLGLGSKKDLLKKYDSLIVKDLGLYRGFKVKKLMKIDIPLPDSTCICLAANNFQSMGVFIQK